MTQLKEPESCPLHWETHSCLQLQTQGFQYPPYPLWEPAQMSQLHVRIKKKKAQHLKIWIQTDR